MYVTDRCQTKVSLNAPTYGMGACKGFSLKLKGNYVYATCVSCLIYGNETAYESRTLSKIWLV